MSGKLEVVSVNISREKGTVKEPVDAIEIDARGIVGDAHAGVWHRQVSLLSQESIDRFSEEMGRELRPGEFAENIAVRGLDFSSVAVLDRFSFGDVRLEVTQIGKKCHGDGCAIFREVGRCVMPKEGLFTRVVSGGRIAPGDSGQFEPRPLKFLVLTLSDRAAAGEYEDRSGPKISEMLQAWLLEKRWHPQIVNRVLPDDADKLRQTLITAVAEDVDVVVTSGGTGVGPRDITPECVSEVCEKLIPGIMENIRIKFGSEKPNALLSRSVAGVSGKTQIHALPGSVKAVTEYMGEILKTLEHIIFMLHGLDVH